MTAFFKNRRGSVTIMAVMILLVLGGLMAAASPMIINEVKMNTVNRDMIEAQYAAEAGAKVGIAAIYAKKIEWSWLGSGDMDNFQPLIPGSSNKQYSVAISPTPPSTADGWKAGDQYTITSKGKVNGAEKTVKVKVTVGGKSSVVRYASFSNGPMDIVSGSVTGDIASNGLITVGYGMTVQGTVTYSNQEPVIKGTAGTVYADSIGTLDVASLMKYSAAAPAMPTMPTLSAVHSYGQLLPRPAGGTATIDLTGAYDYTSNPTSGVYYYDSSLADWWQYTYNVPAGQKVFIYINGDYTVGMPITGSGDITIYVTGKIDVNKNITGSNVTIYSKGDIDKIESDSTITGSKSVKLFSNGNIKINGSITAPSVGVYAQQRVYLYQKTISGDKIDLQATGDFYISGGNVIANTGGTVDITTYANLDMGAGSVVGSVVTMKAKTASAGKNSSSGLHGVDINKGYPDNKTYIYVNGDVNMASGTIGGLSMIVSMGSVNLHGTESSAIIIANGDIEAASGSSGGLYANGSIYIHGAKVSYSSSDFSKLVTETSTKKFTIDSWGK